MFDFFAATMFYDNEETATLSEEEWEATMDARNLWGVGEYDGRLCETH